MAKPKLYTCSMTDGNWLQKSIPLLALLLAEDSLSIATLQLRARAAKVKDLLNILAWLELKGLATATLKDKTWMWHLTDSGKNVVAAVEQPCIL